MVGVGKPKGPPRPPAGMSGPKPPMDEMEIESPEQQGKEDSRMDAIESKLDRIIDALGLNEEAMAEPEGAMPMGAEEMGE